MSDTVFLNWINEQPLSYLYTFESEYEFTIEDGMITGYKSNWF